MEAKAQLAKQFGSPRRSGSQNQISLCPRFNALYPFVSFALIHSLLRFITAADPREIAHCEPLGARFTYLTAPFATEQNAPEGRMWWTPTKLEGGGWDYGGVDETLRAVRDAQRASGPFDGVLGFSQGAGLASLLVALHEKAHADAPLSLRFAILCGGFPFRAANLPEYAALLKDLRTPSFHTIGAKDELVKPATSRLLKGCFAEPQVLEHPGGHVVPSDAESLAQLATFLDAQRLEARL